MFSDVNSIPYSEYWAALVEWSDEAIGRGRDVYVAPSVSKLLEVVSESVIGHYGVLFDSRWGFIDLRGPEHQIAKFDGRHYDEYELDSASISEEASRRVQNDLEFLKAKTSGLSILGDWYAYCCELQGAVFEETDYAFVRIEGPITNFVRKLLSVEQEYFDSVEVKRPVHQRWFDKLAFFASLPVSAWNERSVFEEFIEHVGNIKFWEDEDMDDDAEEVKSNSKQVMCSGSENVPKELEAPAGIRESWTEKLASLLARNRYTQAFRLLDKVIEDDIPLFRCDPEVFEGRRMAWLCRIDLLREQGRLAEALAWTCLECEINHQNVTAQALKEQLKRRLHLGSLEGQENPKGAERDFDGWEGVAGMRELKAVLERDFILPLQEPELYERYRVDVPNGVLFYGPPGCGKTFIARALAKRLNYTFYDIAPSDLASPYVHGTQEKIGELFSKATETAPSLIFFDELDSLIPSRSEHDVGHHYSAEVNEFLVQLNECSKRKISVVGATNFPKKVDSAARRPGRLDKHIFIGPPDIEARQEALRLFMKDRPQCKIKWFGIAQYSEGHSFSELKFVVDEAARTALSDRRPISSDDLLAVIDLHPPQPKKSAEEYLL